MEALSDAQLAAEVAGISGIELWMFFRNPFFQNVSENYLNNRDFDNPPAHVPSATRQKSILSYDSPA